MPGSPMWKIWWSKRALSMWLAIGLLTMDITHARTSSDVMPWTDGVYKLVSNNLTAGTLVIHRSSLKTVEFSIEVVHCMHSCGSDNAVNHLAVIDRGVASTIGVRASYSMPSDEATVCILKLRRESGSSVLVTQDNVCSGFGQGMSVAGRYQLAKRGVKVSGRASHLDGQVR